MATGSVSNTMCQSVSPAKPDNNATEPKEEATCVHTDLFSKPDAEKVVSALQCRDEVSSIKVKDESYSGLLTKEMIEEEKRLEEEGEQELEHQRKEQDRLWEQLDESDREQRYQRLQFLLQRSNLYTEYLINRMKQQQEEEVKRKKRRAQKQAMQEQRQQDGQEKQEAENSSAHENLQETECLRQRKRKEMEEADENTTTCADGKTQEAKRLKITGPSVESAGKNNSVESSSSDTESLEGEKTTDQEQTLDTLNADDKPREFNGEPVPEDQPVLLTGGVLRPYQIEGFFWLKTLYENGVNGILADEMGLGKTVQCVAMFAHLVYMGVRGPFLVCAPLSTIPNWFTEFQRFAPKVPVLLYHGNKEERHGLRIKIAELHEVREGVKVHPCVITSYEVAMMDQKFLQKCEWQYFIVDEGHRIKNTHCRLIRALRMYKTTNRLLVTGTPLQNNLSELWSLLNFLLPEIFDDLGSFEAWFDVEHIGDGSACKEIAADEQRKNVLSMLHQILTPFMLRRLKTDVDLRIPPKKEVLVYAPLQPLQQEFYAALIDKTIFSKIEGKNGRTEKVEVRSNGRPVRRTTKVKIDYKLMMADSRYEKAPKTRRRVEQEDEEFEGWVQSLIEMQQKRQCQAEPEQKVSQLSIKLRNVMMQLRKCCSHPFLLEHPLNPKTGELCLDERIVTESGKMMVLDCMLKELKKRGHKVLIFSQMTKMLDLLEDYCQLRNFGYCRLDGSMNINDRKENMQEFQNNPESFIFLLSTRAGGLGINLTAADTVIIYDSDWNPQCDLQAQDRCHRIGQMRPVMVYRLVTANTIDQRIVERAAAKRKLEKLVIHQGKFKSGMKNFKTSLEPISSEELLALLNSKDYESEVKGSNGQEVMSRTELDQLLDRSDLEARWTANLQGVKSGAKSEDRPLGFPLGDLLCTLGSAPRKVQQKKRQGDGTCRASKSTEGCKDETIAHQPIFKVIDIDDGDSIPGGCS